MDFGRKPAVPFKTLLERLRARADGGELRAVPRAPLAAELSVAPGPLVARGAARGGSGWTVALLDDGTTVALLQAGEARLLARDLITMADLLEGKSW